VPTNSRATVAVPAAIQASAATIREGGALVVAWSEGRCTKETAVGGGIDGGVACGVCERALGGAHCGQRALRVHGVAGGVNGSVVAHF
jgi:hypothetical protein